MSLDTSASPRSLPSVVQVSFCHETASGEIRLYNEHADITTVAQGGVVVGVSAEIVWSDSGVGPMSLRSAAEWLRSRGYVYMSGTNALWRR